MSPLVLDVARPARTRAASDAERTRARALARFEAAVEQYTRPIVNYLYRLTRERQLAEDLAQEVFLRLYQEWERIREATLAAWLYRVARNLATDWHRKKKAVPFSKLDRYAEHDEVAPTPWLISGDGTPPENLYRKELAALVERTVQALSPKLRDVFLLCDVEKLSYREAADVLGCPTKTISSRLARARVRFRAAIGPYLDGDDGPRRTGPSAPDPRP